MPAVIDEDLIPYIQNVVFLKCAPDWEMPKHRLDVCNLTYLVQGEARYTINNEDIDLAQGNLLSLPAGSVCSGISFPGRLMHCFSVDFYLQNTKKQDLILPFPVVSLPGCHNDIMRMFLDLSFSWQSRQPGCLIKSRGLFQCIIHRFLELVIFTDNSGGTDSRVTRAIRYTTAHYSERISVKQMADLAGLNPTYFGSLFRKETGISFNLFLTRLRIKNAEELLASGRYTVSAAAEACGFADTSHFYKQFKSIKGFPPSHGLSKKF